MDAVHAYSVASNYQLLIRYLVNLISYGCHIEIKFLYWPIPSNESEG